MNKKGFFGMMALLVGVMLVSGGGDVFALDNIKMPTKPKKWTSEYMRWDRPTNASGSVYSEKFDTIMIIRNVGASNPCVEMKDGKMVQASSSTNLKNVANIKTGSSQQVEFVTWTSKFKISTDKFGTANWDTMKAKGGVYWRLESNSELVLDFHSNGNVSGFWLRKGTLNVDLNYATVGEAVEFAEAIAANIKYDDIKRDVADLKRRRAEENPGSFSTTGPIKTRAEFVALNLANELIGSEAVDAFLKGAFLGALPTWLSLPGEYMNVMPTYRKNAAMAYAIAIAYGFNPTPKEFEMHLYKLLSGDTSTAPEKFKAATGAAVGEAMEKGATLIAKKIAPNLIGGIPVIGTAIGAVSGAISGASDVKAFGKSAKEFYAKLAVDLRGQNW